VPLPDVYLCRDVFSVFCDEEWVRRDWCKFGCFPRTVYWLARNAACVSGQSAVTYWLAVSRIYSLVASDPFSQIADMETWTSGGLSISGSCRVSISDRTSTSVIAASPCAWPEDHGRGRFYVTYVTRTCHHGCRISFPGRSLRCRLAWQVAASYITDDFTHRWLLADWTQSLRGICIHSVCLCGGKVSRLARKSGLRFQTAVTRKR